MTVIKKQRVTLVKNHLWPTRASSAGGTLAELLCHSWPSEAPDRERLRGVTLKMGYLSHKIVVEETEFEGFSSSKNLEAVNSTS